jgi:DNA-binding response OmpR family regulator
VPVIVLSGMRVAQAVAEEMGAAAAITKPFELDNVVATVGRMLDQSSG